MATSKVLLLYVICPLSDPTAIMLWQKELCLRLNLRGRIIVSPQGINATVEGDVGSCKQYLKYTKQYSGFKDLSTTVKWSDGTGRAFPRLSVKVRPELVTFGTPDEINVSYDGVINGGTHLTPEQVNEMVAERPETVFFDGRNAYEASIGKFEGAVVPNVRTTREFVALLDSGSFDELKDKPIITYCTGGIRCEFLTALMRNRGFKEVYQIDGGIARYAEKYGQDAFWKGSLAVFDDREVLDYGEVEQPIGTCQDCGQPAGLLADCQAENCRERFAVCKVHKSTPTSCSAHAPATY